MRKAFASGQLFGTTHGSAPWRVLALPGWMHTVSDFDGVLTGLDAGAVAVDLPGFGGVNPEPPEPWGAEGYAAWVESVLDDLDGPVVVVGHSFGGRVAVHLAARRPDAVRALVLAGVPLLRRTDRPATKPATSFRAARWLHRRGLLGDDRMEAMRRKHGSADYRAASGVMRDVLVRVTNETYEDQLRAVSCPVELVWGDGDDAAPVEVARRAADILGDRARLTVLDGVGHQVPLSSAADLRAAVQRQLAT